jgi:exonuclease III
LLQELNSHNAHITAAAELQSHIVWHSTHQQYRRGKGVAIALHRRLEPHYHSHRIYDEHQLIHLQLKGMLPERGIVHAICCYLPHTTSTQLHENDITTRYSQLQLIIDSIAPSRPGHLVIAAGDFNAKVGAGEMAASSTTLAAIVQHNASSQEQQRISTDRKQQLQGLDRAGEMLNDLCMATDMINLTGLTASDSPAKPSFCSDSNGSGSRVDHALVSPSVLPHLQRHQVLTDQLGSDHKPVLLQLRLQQQPSTSTQAADEQVPIRHVIPNNNRAIVQQYITSVASPETWASYSSLAESAATTSDQLDQALSDLLSSTATSAGYRTKSIGQPSQALTRTRSKYNTWHDSTCKQLKAQIMAIRQQQDPNRKAELQQLANTYKKRVANLVRKHRLAVAMQRVADWQRNRNSFWRAYKPPSQHCPFTARAIAQHFSSKLNSFQPAPAQPAQPAQPAASQPSTPAPTIGDITSSCPTIPEISAAITKMDNTSAGPDGIPSALLKPNLPPPPTPPTSPDAATHTNPDNTQDPLPTTKDAIAKIAQGLHLLYSRISATGQVPEQWRTALLVPIYKGKGQAADISNYRPLSMPTVACRLWSSIMNQRLTAAAKEILPDTMFGFRPGRRCADPLFVLRHLIDMKNAKVGGKFCAAFMDLSGAYDSVDRSLLFAKLEGLGMAAHTVNTLRSLYEGTQCIVKAHQGTFAPFPVGCGLRQGCPLSTTLFNLFIWDLHARLAQTGSGVKLPCKPTPEGTAQHTLLSDLGYADDYSLCASSHPELQRLLDCFDAYCKEHGLLINPSKCEVVVFAGKCNTWSQLPDWSVGGAKLPRSQKFKYLGVEIHCTQGIKFAVQQRLSRMVGAQSAISSRLRELQIPRDPSLLADLFDSITAASGSYGCEIWSTPFLDDWHLWDCPLQRYQAAVYKQLLGVKRATGSRLVFFEIGKFPMQVQWLLRTINYWNKLVTDQADSRLLKDTLQANVHFGLRAGHACWSRELHAGLQFVNPDFDWESHMLELRPIESPKAVAQLARAKFSSSILEFDKDPSDPDCPNRQHNTFGTLMYTAAPDGRLYAPVYMKHPTQVSKKQTVAKCRLSGAPIRTNMNHSTPYQERVCHRCGNGVDNEHHMLIACTYPGLVAARSQHP